MAEIDDFVIKIEKLEKENKRLTSKLNIAMREIDKCHKAINRYQKMVEDESEYFSRLAKDMRTYSNNIQELYEQGK